VRIVRPTQTVLHSVFSLNYLLLSDEEYTFIDPPLIEGVWEIENQPPLPPPPPPAIPPDMFTTDDLPQGALNLYFTEAKASAAAVSDAIVDGIVNQAPSQNAVFDALSLKSETASNVGTGLGLFKQKTLTNFEFKKLLAGANITLNSYADEIEVVSAPGEVNTASNSPLGLGAGNVFKNKIAEDLVFKKINAGNNISIVDDVDDVTISAAPGEVNTASNSLLGAGYGLYQTKNVDDLVFKTVNAVNGISVVGGADDVTITGDILEVTVTLTPADIDVLDTTPFTVIPAPGVGNYIDLQSVEFYLDFNTTPYASGAVGLDYASVSPVPARMLYIPSLLDAIASFRVLGKMSFLSEIKLNEAMDIVATSPTAGGDSDLMLRARYRIVAAL